MTTEEIKARLHASTRRGHAKVTDDQLVVVTAAVLEIVGELAAEVALVLGELELRIRELESR